VSIARRAPRRAPAAALATLATFCAVAAARHPASAAATARAAPSREPVVGGPCEGCEAVFEGLPERLASEARIAPAGEPGEPMVLEGVVRRPDGTPAPGVVVYAYQTNARGEYPPDERFAGRAARRHGMLRGWARTDSVGRYRFDTIRPAGYPGTDIPQHVHMHVIEPGRCTYFIDDALFEDDPRLTPRRRRSHDAGRGGSGVGRPARDASGAWRMRRDITLGAGIPGYDRCGERAGSGGGQR
jgi:protocatechuate 3,4-dioxygenase beta subunit